MDRYAIIANTLLNSTALPKQCGWGLVNGINYDLKLDLVKQNLQQGIRHIQEGSKENAGSILKSMLFQLNDEDGNKVLDTEEQKKLGYRLNTLESCLNIKSANPTDITPTTPSPQPTNSAPTNTAPTTTPPEKKPAAPTNKPVQPSRVYTGKLYWCSLDTIQIPAIQEAVIA